jgi:hypothetical protein
LGYGVFVHVFFTIYYHRSNKCQFVKYQVDTNGAKQAKCILPRRPLSVKAEPFMLRAIKNPNN